MSRLLDIKNLAVSYGAVNALKQVSLHVDTNEIVTIIGGNGAGKSTMMRALSGIEKSTGDIAFAGQDLGGVSAHKRVGLGIAHVPEGRQVFPDQTVHDNLMLGAFLRKESPAELAAEIENCFAMFPRLKERRDQYAGTLSGGEQQMLAICRALMSKPRILMLDEPSLGLAPLIVAEIFKIIKSLKERGMTILLVEQMANQALAISDRAYVLEVGSIVMEGTGQELLASERVREAYLGKHKS
ncbi:ABC transporter ATP-binding protein [Achromobacter insolitus]|jgi:branched-chain amino acid transport system ATP-binding protein|uniref:High-affinity branched-chain amino acid transport ATP-binding protein LivF n=1 Tax=Achromobacter insolitus TaxID=217204 RepID=A0A6S7FF53_9BURK|nr:MULTISPECIES: ABC transporter ATP-binding protein [Achromobacter]GLK94841.1 ABC transporter ATP-binding protein [Achromobacter xylosoxidans]AVG42588.1 ABC transporter ATP-binding protein [Achromobacter insolitus]AXA73347.1 ABC transporter ATP-binding protein [Achromobacter insolitus]MCP1399882.1 branched-chain amino acid transport system ATP-binding protein [Achromobacter insolitus]MDQ6216440.1 ABC transporter ATP-binding protein [Achromobacter insolitus]